MATKPGDLDGANLIPHLKGDLKTPPHDALYWRRVAQSAIREGNWKLLCGGNREYLYDLGTDPGLFNVISRGQKPDGPRTAIIDIGRLLLGIKTNGPRMSESVSELNAGALERELMAALGLDAAQCRKIIQEGLVSNSLTDQAVSLLAQAKYVEAEQKALVSTDKNASQSVEAAVFDYRLAASACFFRKEYRSMMDHCHAALKIAPRECSPLLWGTLQSDPGDALRLLRMPECSVIFRSRLRDYFRQSA